MMVYEAKLGTMKIDGSESLTCPVSQSAVSQNYDYHIYMCLTFKRLIGSQADKSINFESCSIFLCANNMSVYKVMPLVSFAA